MRQSPKISHILGIFAQFPFSYSTNVHSSILNIWWTWKLNICLKIYLISHIRWKQTVNYVYQRWRTVSFRYLTKTHKLVFVCGMKILLQHLNLAVKETLLQKTAFKRIVSWDWDWLEWIVNQRSKELRIAGAYLYCFLMPFSCYNF